MSTLVIVESPAKAKTIKKYLGPGYEVVASMGHVRDLPAAKLSVDVKHDFAPKYAVIKGKEKLVSELKKMLKKAIKLSSQPTLIAREKRYRGTFRPCSISISRTRTESLSTR